MDGEWSIYFFVFIIGAILMVRLDRLGKQLEAVGVSIRADLARTKEDRDEIIKEWKQNQKQARKDAWQFWIFWSVIGTTALIWKLR